MIRASRPRVGNVVSIDLIASELLPAGLRAFDFRVLFDPALLSLRSGEFGDLLGSSSVGPSGSILDGTVILSGLSLEDSSTLLSLQQGSRRLVTLHFDAVGVGNAILAFDGSGVFSDADGQPINDVAFAVGRVRIEAAAAPIPSSALLLLAGVLPWWRHRRRMAG